ncbi:MAG: signal peptidase II [Bacillota bacterium]
MTYHLSLIIDQLSKYLTVIYLKTIESYPLINNVFHLTYAENTGAAFSMFSGKQPLLIILTLIIIVALLFYLIRNLKTDQVFLKFSLSLIIGGALGNLIDRIRLNYVVDMLDFTLINYPVFNMADVFVVSGAVIFAYTILTSSTDNSVD